MSKVAIVLLAGTETHEGLALMTNAFQTTREFDRGGDEIILILDGAGTEWVKTLSDPSHKAHQLYKSVKDNITGVWSFCSDAFEVKEDVKHNELPLADEFHGHPSFKKLIDEGFEVLTF